MTKIDSIIFSAGPDAECERWEMPQVLGRVAGQDRMVNDCKPPTADELKNLQKQAYDEAYQQGRTEGSKKGYAEGHEKALGEYRDKAATLQKIMLNLHAPLEQMDRTVEQSMADLIALISRHIVRRELRLDEGAIVGAVREAMSMLPPGARHPRIYLNPDDIDIVREALSLGEDDRQWKVESDPLVSRGGCMLETQSSFIDASIEARLSALIASMLGGERETDR